MMRIIKAAKKTDEFITECGHCDSIIGITPSDVRWGNGSYRFDCPVCNHINDLGYDDLDDMFPWIMEEDDEVPGDNSVRINSL